MCVVACTFLWHPMVCNFECFASLKHAPLCQAEEEHPLAQKARLMAIGKGQQKKAVRKLRIRWQQEKAKGEAQQRHSRMQQKARSQRTYGTQELMSWKRVWAKLT